MLYFTKYDDICSTFPLLNTRKILRTDSKNIHSILFQTGHKKISDLPCRQIKKIEDVLPGDVINFSYCWLPHHAVVVQVGYPETVSCDIIHYNYPGITGTRTVVEEKFTFELADQNVFVHDYSDKDIYESNEVVERAKSRLGEQKFNTFTNRSSHLAKWCKIKKKSHID